MSDDMVYINAFTNSVVKLNQQPTETLFNDIRTDYIDDQTILFIPVVLDDIILSHYALRVNCEKDYILSQIVLFISKDSTISDVKLCFVDYTFEITHTITLNEKLREGFINSIDKLFIKKSLREIGEKVGIRNAINDIQYIKLSEENISISDNLKKLSTIAYNLEPKLLESINQINAMHSKIQIVTSIFSKEDNKELDKKIYIGSLNVFKKSFECISKNLNDITIAIEKLKTQPNLNFWQKAKINGFNTRLIIIKNTFISLFYRAFSLTAKSQVHNKAAIDATNDFSEKYETIKEIVSSVIKMLSVSDEDEIKQFVKDFKK